MSARNWLAWIAAIDTVVALITLALVAFRAQWSGADFGIALGAGLVLIISLAALSRALGLL
jgi:hypothetical protein